MVVLCRRGVLVALRKPDGRIRPIALTEALAQLAKCCIIDAKYRSLKIAQFSEHENAEAETVVR